MMNEEWRDIKGYEHYYQVSDLGRVRSLSRITYVIGVDRHKGKLRHETWQRLGKILTPIESRGCLYVHLHKEGRPRKTVAIKRLVAETFIEGFDPKLTTNSIRLKDKSKPCSVDNLYVTRT